MNLVIIVCWWWTEGRKIPEGCFWTKWHASLFEKLGCKAAYNLDGGHCSFMTLGSRVANHPYKPEHTVPDGIFIMEGME